MIFFYLLVSIMPLVRNPLWSRFVGDLTLTKYVGLAAIAYAIIYLTIYRAWPRSLACALFVVFVLYYALAVTSYAMKGPPTPVVVSPVASYTSFLALFFVTAVVIDSRERLRWTLYVAIGALAFASIYVIREWQKFHILYPGFRPGWEVGDPNYYTLSALLVLPPAIYLLRTRRSWWVAIYCLVCMALTLVGVALAASRGGLLGLGAAFLVVVWRSERRVRNMIALAVCVLPLLLISPSSPLQRFLHPNYGDVEGEATRLELWRAGLRMVEDHPLTGIGTGNFKFVVTQYETQKNGLQKIAHNTYVEVAAELGLPGLALYLSILYFALHYLGQARRMALERRDEWLASAATGIQAGLVGCVVAIVFLSAEAQKFIWLMIALAPCVRTLASRTVDHDEDDGGEPFLETAEPDDEIAVSKTEEVEFVQ